MAKGTLRVVIAGDSGPLKKTLGSAGGMIGKFAVGAATAVGAAAVFSVKKFADFDQAMTASTAIMGDVSDAMRKDMSDAAREVAKTTKFSATEAAESYFFLASAGMDAEQSIGALPKVAAFAQAGNFDMALATDLATDAQSALGLTSDDTAQNLENLTRTTDVLVKANTLANASVEEFATSMTRKAGAALKNVNKDIEEGTAVLAVFADQGIKGERAGTILANTLDGLSGGARKNSDAFEELGVAVFDGEGEMRNMADIVEDLEIGLEGMTTEQKLSALAQLGFNRRTSEGILALLGNSEALREYEEELRNAAGTTEEVADKQLQTFWAQLDLLKDQLIDVALSIGESLMPALTGLVTWFQDNIPTIESNAEGLIGAIELLFTGARTTGRETTREFGQHVEDMRREGEEAKSWMERELVPLMGQLRAGWSKDLEETKEDHGSFWQTVAARARNSGELVGEIFRMFQGAFTGDWELFWSGLKGMFRKQFDIVNDAVGGGLREQHGFWMLGLVRMGIAIRGWWNNTAFPFLRSVPGRIADFFRGLPGQLASIGRDAVSGLWSGFRAKWNEFTAWVSNLPGAGIVRNIAGQLGIGSPSKVMAEQIGGPIVEGIEMGMRDRFGHLEHAAAEIPELMRIAESDARTSLAHRQPRAMGRGERTVIVQVTNQGVIGSQRELENWLTRSLENLRRRGRLPAGV